MQKGMFGGRNFQFDQTAVEDQIAQNQSSDHTLQSDQSEEEHQLSMQQKLDLFEKALAEAELARQSEAVSSGSQPADLGLADQAYSQTNDHQPSAEEIDQDYSNLGRKEAPVGTAPLVKPETVEASPPDQASNLQYEQSVGPVAEQPVSSLGEQGVGGSVEQAAGIQYVEEEKSPELSPEVEKYIQEVKKQQEKAPREIVIADDAADLPNQEQYVSEPVVVVPITPEIEKKGKSKPPKFSVRWLVEWSQKIIKMFAGKVVYRRVESRA